MPYSCCTVHFPGTGCYITPARQPWATGRVSSSTREDKLPRTKEKVISEEDVMDHRSIHYEEIYDRRLI